MSKKYPIYDIPDDWHVELNPDTGLDILKNVIANIEMNQAILIGVERRRVEDGLSGYDFLIYVNEENRVIH